MKNVEENMIKNCFENNEMSHFEESHEPSRFPHSSLCYTSQPSYFIFSKTNHFPETTSLSQYPLTSNKKQVSTYEATCASSLPFTLKDFEAQKRKSTEQSTNYRSVATELEKISVQASRNCDSQSCNQCLVRELSETTSPTTQMKKHSFCKTNHASLNMTNDQVLKYDPQHDNQQIEKEDAEIRSSFPIKEQQSSLSVIDQVKHSQLLSFASTIPLALSKTTFEFYSEMCNEFKKSQARIVESKTKNINPIEITVDSVEAVDSVTRSQGRCSPSLSSLSENSIDQLLEENITHWKPQPETQAAMCYDFDFKVDGVSQSSVAMHRKSEMIERWKSADAEFIKEYTPTLSSSMFVRGNLEGVDLDEESRRLRKEIVKRQIKEAKQHKKLFGEWVRKQWIQDESERRMWQEAEKKMRIKIERTEQEITEGKVEKTLEELISELKEAECVGATEEILQNLKSEIKKREQKLYKKIQKDELTFFQRDWIWAARHNRRDISSGEMKKILRNEEDSACTVGFTNNECSSSFELSKNSEKTLSSVEPESVFDPNLQTPCNKISSVGSTFTTAMHFSKQPNNKILKAQASNLSFKIPSSEQRVSSANSEILAKLHFLQSEKIHVSDFEELLSPYSVLNDCIEEEEIPTTEEVVLLDRDEWFDRFSDPFLNPKIKRRMKRRGEDVQAFVEQESQVRIEIISNPPIIVPLRLLSELANHLSSLKKALHPKPRQKQFYFHKSKYSRTLFF